MPAFPTYILLQTPRFVNTYFVNNSFLSKNLFHRWRRPWRGLPRNRPPSMHTVCPGACAGEFLLGADEFLEDCEHSGRVQLPKKARATADIYARQIAFHGNMRVWMLASLKKTSPAAARRRGVFIGNSPNRRAAAGEGPGGGRLGGRARLLKGGPPSKVFPPHRRMTLSGPRRVRSSERR